MPTTQMTPAEFIAYAKKFIAALVAAAMSAITAGLIDGQTAQWIQVGIAFLGALGVYYVQNVSPVRGDTESSTAEPEEGEGV